MAMIDGKEKLTDAVKASVLDSGALANLKRVTHDNAHQPDKDSLHELKQQAHATIDNIQQLLDSGKLDDSTSQKLSSALSKLKGVLGKGVVSRDALAMALSEAVTAVGNADSSKGMSAQQKAEKLWKRVEADNKEIDDDFIKMRRAGIVLNQSLLDRHNQLMADLQAHPHDIAKQKELDAVDDAMLMQAEPQLEKHTDAKPSFEDAKKKSKDRHEAVDKGLAAVENKKSSANTAFDDDAPASGGKLTMNDVTLQSIGQKSKSAAKLVS
jgi:hypothetical protein